MDNNLPTNKINLPESLRQSILTGSHNVSLQGHATQNVLFAYYISRQLPFNYFEMDNAVSRMNHWEATLRPLAKSMVMDNCKRAMIMPEATLDYVRRFINFRATYGMDVWFSLYQTYGLSLTEDSGLDEDHQVQLINATSEAFHANKDMLLDKGRINVYRIEMTIEKIIPDDLPKRVFGTMLGQASKIIRLIAELHEHNCGNTMKLNSAAKPFLESMLDSVIGTGSYDDTLISFIIDTTGRAEKNPGKDQSTVLEGVM